MDLSKHVHTLHYGILEAIKNFYYNIYINCSCTYIWRILRHKSPPFFRYGGLKNIRIGLKLSYLCFLGIKLHSIHKDNLNCMSQMSNFISHSILVFVFVCFSLCLFIYVCINTEDIFQYFRLLSRELLVKVTTATLRLTTSPSPATLVK